MSTVVIIIIILGILLFLGWNIFGLVKDIKEHKKKKNNATVDSEEKK